MLALSMLWLYTQNFLPMCAHYFFKLSSTIRRSVILRPIDAQLVNLARDGVAADAQAYRGIVLAAVRVSQRGLDQRRFELAAERVLHFGAAGRQHLCASFSSRAIQLGPRTQKPFAETTGAVEAGAAEAG